MKKFLFEYLHQSYLLIALAIGVIIGTVLVIILRFSFFTSIFWLVLVGIVCIIAFFKPNRAFLLVVLLCGITLAFFRSAEDMVDKKYVQQFIGKSVEIVGKISEDPDVENGTSFKLDLQFIGEEPAGGTVYVQLSQNKNLERDDIVTLYGKFSDGFGTYVGAMYRPNLKAITKPNPPNFLLKMRNWFADRIRQFVPEKESALGLAYVLGMKNGLDDGLMEILRVVGLTHIVVASGTHLSILVGACRKIFGKLSRFAGLLFSIIFIVVFASMIGWTASITRAALMSILSLAAWYVGRKSEPYRMIILVMAITLLINPMYVINLGWLLSFGSFTGIMILGPKLTKFFYGEKKPNMLAEVIITTIAATLMCTPILLYFYGELSLISVAANLLILPTIPYVMGMVFATGALSFFPFFARILGKITTLALDYHLLVMNFFGEQTMFLFKIPAENPRVFLLYLPIIAWLVIGAWREKRRKRLRPR